MNKTITANISGIVFNIDEQAYEVLYNYLQTIRGYFSAEDGRDEIMADIEARFAELFSHNNNELKNVVGMEDVQNAIEIMGQPDQYIDVEEGEEQTPPVPEQETMADSGDGKSKSRRIFRDPDNTMIGGVCSGLAAYLGWDPVIMRILFLVFFFFGFGFLAYIILWIVMPVAKTTADKLEMRGERVNASNIAREVKDRASDLEQKIRDFDDNVRKSNGRRGVQQIKDFFNMAFLALSKVFGVAMIGFAVLLTVLLVWMLFGGDSFMVSNDMDLSNLTWTEFTRLIFPTENVRDLAYVCGIILIGVPIVMLTTSGLRILFNLKTPIKGLRLGAFILFLIGAVLAFYVVSRTASSFSEHNSSSEIIALDSIPSDTLTIDLLNGRNVYTTESGNSYDNTMWSYDSTLVGMRERTVTVKKSRTGKVEIEIIRHAHGSNMREALDRANDIRYEYEVDGSTLRFDNHISFSKSQLFRDQSVDVIVYLPVGKAVYLTRESLKVFYDIKNVTNTHDWYMIEETWVMLENGLTCLSCEGGLDGPYQDNYSDGQIHLSGNMLNGQWDGLLKEYYPNGTIKSQQEYDKGELNGKSKFFDEEGRLESEKNYFNGELHGEVIVFSPEGEVISSATYNYGLLKQ